MGPRAILHVDMDAFFAAVEQWDHPALRGRPVLVGVRHRGVVAACSYEARRFGVRSAMPMQEAVRRCPDAVVVRPRHARYVEVSQQIFAIFGRFTPLVEGLSLDEAFLDITGTERLFGPPAALWQRLRAAIRAEVGLTASAGLAPSKFVAKIASDLRKPDGFVSVPAAEVPAFLSPLPLWRMWGVGRVAQARLEALGLRSIGDLAHASATLLEPIFGRDVGRMQALARGIDDRPVEVERRSKSVGAEDTFERDLVEVAAVERALLAQAGRVSRRLWQRCLCGQVVTLKLKFGDFRLVTRRRTLSDPIADLDSIYAAACALFADYGWDGRGIRLTGVSVSGLTPGRPPLTLLDSERQVRLQALEGVRAKIEARFGSKGLQRGTLVPDA